MLLTPLFHHPCQREGRGEGEGKGGRREGVQSPVSTSSSGALDRKISHPAMKLN